MSVDNETQGKQKEEKRYRMVMIPLAAVATIFEIMAGNYGLALLFGGLCAVWVWKGPRAPRG